MILKETLLTITVSRFPNSQKMSLRAGLRNLLLLYILVLNIYVDVQCTIYNIGVQEPCVERSIIKTEIKK